MKINEKLLSICIPTFEGSHYLNDLLKSLVASLVDFDHVALEILVSDNNTNEQAAKFTASTVQSYSQTLPISLIDNPRKDLLLDGNLLNLLERSTGRFVWFICDDDAVTETAVQEVVSVLRKHKDDLNVLFMSYHESDENLHILERPIRPEINEEGRFYNRDEFIRATDLQFGLVSSLVVKRVSSLKCNLQDYVGQDSLHIPMVLQLADINGGYVIKKKLVLMRDNNTRWGASSDQIIIIGRLFGLFGIMHRLQYDKETIGWVQRYFFKSISRTILRCHVRGQFDKSEVIFNLKKLYYSSRAKLLLLILLIYTPRKFVRLTNKLRLLFK